MDSKTIDDINDSIDDLEKKAGEQFLELEMKSPTGDIHDASEISATIHDTKNVNMIPIVSGNVDIACTILTAAGKPGSREAKFGTKFNLSKDGPYPTSTTPSGLSDEDKTTYEALTVMTGKGKTILEYMKKGNPISTAEAKKCRIIDKIQKFKSKYRQKKQKIRKADTTVQNSQSNTVLSDPSVSNQNSIPLPEENKIKQASVGQTNENQSAPNASRRSKRKINK
ncbi:MAG TPA: hypothetical protein PKA90_16085 [Ignavibacteria bacterium]|nr:hypothetical protein [Ignavibacteria bacterium]